MANQVTHTDVKILPRERACIAPPTSNPEITYAELRVHRKSERTSRSETSPSGPGSQCSSWFYVAVVLGLITLVFMAVLISIFWRGNSKSPSMLRTTCTENTTSSGESPCTGRCSMTISGLMDYLCDKREGRTECLLCPPGWMLHRGSCYYFSEQLGTWDASMRNCSGRKSQLLVVEDEAEMEFIATRTETKYFWIGLNFQEKEGRWMWLGDSQLEGNRLSLVVENGTGDGKNCFVFNKEKLYAESCPSLNRWICKKNAFTLAPWNTPEH
ncbi:killer cell lectin-like receptor subfamily B member 1B allele C isoform X1 [Chelonia mydas]|uniref:killer cell lectin-like receptor subfamily B member 1B allele C isoform X1 n=1 Tax=Chelonia mydas TaxID=8469 RepID=UPI0018A1F9AB|nr:killer cell lectin-like receptor subfamily B member 1B allele C isoform X1 [Chelonia mydas]